MISEIKKYLLSLQLQACNTLSEVDGRASFIEDGWMRRGAEKLEGNGLTRVLTNGGVFEKAGVNFSHVTGVALPPSATSIRSSQVAKPFEALGVSLVIHPNNPYVPTSHANVRFFTTKDADDNPIWWFGGGYDLTPYYGFEEDCVHWHSVAKKACEPFGADIYPEFKKWCDNYFYLKHRQESRGIGGLFFDDLNRWELTRCFDFIKSVGDSYLEAYVPIVEKRKLTSFGEREKSFQKVRRGRYVEFNLIYDRGTLFGLQSGGRTESILMSLPPAVSWDYAASPEAGTPEARLLTNFLVAKEWV